jgi:peptidoglycan/xylan/chitin deacetylase (PgdA/CDA1 family)
MHRYFLHMPWWVKHLFPNYTWTIPSAEKAVYLTFDDGPHPEITNWVLDELKKAGAKASFFCVGSNVARYPEVYQRILDEGHSTGNHTHHHLNGWNTSDEVYLEDVKEAAGLIRSSLFRPPYGRIRRSQARQISKAMGRTKVQIIMWNILSGDFDATFSSEQCLINVTRHVKAGAIIVLHDSEKAEKHLRFVLPALLQFLAREGYVMKRIDMGNSG